MGERKALLSWAFRHIKSAKEREIWKRKQGLAPSLWWRSGVFLYTRDPCVLQGGNLGCDAMTKDLRLCNVYGNEVNYLHGLESWKSMIEQCQEAMALCCLITGYTAEGQQGIVEDREQRLHPASQACTIHCSALPQRGPRVNGLCALDMLKLQLALLLICWFLMQSEDLGDKFPRQVKGKCFKNWEQSIWRPWLSPESYL